MGSGRVQISSSLVRICWRMLEESDCTLFSRPNLQIHSCAQLPLTHTHALITHVNLYSVGVRPDLELFTWAMRFASIKPTWCALKKKKKGKRKTSHGISVKCLLPQSYFLFIWQLPQHPVFNYFSRAADASRSNLLWITPLRTNVLWQTPLFQSITRPKSAISQPAKHTPTSNGASFSLRGCNCRRRVKGAGGSLLRSSRAHGLKAGDRSAPRSTQEVTEGRGALPPPPPRFLSRHPSQSSLPRCSDEEQNAAVTGSSSSRLSAQASRIFSVRRR